MVSEETKASLIGGIRISGSYLRNSLPSLVVTRGDPKNVELYPDDVEPPVNWKDYLIQEPRQKENRWIFTPKDGLDEVKIVYKIGKLSPERHSLRVIDGSNLWREIPPKRAWIAN